MEDMGGSSQVQTCSACLDGEDEEACALAVGRLKTLDHPVALGSGNLPVDLRIPHGQGFFKVPAEKFAHFSGLSELFSAWYDCISLAAILSEHTHERILDRSDRAPDQAMV